MDDWLVEVGQNKQARTVIRSLGLPVPVPEKLVRDKGPWVADPLRDRAVVIGATRDAALVSEIAGSLTAAGAEPYVEGTTLQQAAFRASGEAFGRPPRKAAELTESTRVHALVFDASGIGGPLELRHVYDFFHAYIDRLARSGRVVVIGRADPGASPERALVATALEGFVRSLAKEVGRKGATANLVRVEPDADARLDAVLRFVLSPRSAFITAQPITVGKRSRVDVEPLFVRPLDGKIALVTGAARGIGEATARALAQEGAHVVCLDRPADDAATGKLARDIGGTPLLFDVTDPQAPRGIAEALKKLGGVHVVVHNAGITRDKTLARMKPELWEQTIDVNLASVLAITQALEPSLGAGGRIVCLSSIAGIAGNVGQTNYAASKAGIIGYVRALAAKLADRGVTVNAVAPGFIETRMTAAIPFVVREGGRRMSALGQGGLPIDVAQAILFLSSPGAQGITGSVLRVCGGSLIGA
ncbi:3-oxoacyl-ACP reductase [Pendulispora albinea]|uniref:3-oxoacyl-ACP reductase n=1 Tax=Pendulispora albinea TaxID=2741071 RepID=A0ABZ2LRE9_9BACT